MCACHQKVVQPSMTADGTAALPSIVWGSATVSSGAALVAPWPGKVQESASKLRSLAARQAPAGEGAQPALWEVVASEVLAQVELRPRSGVGWRLPPPPALICQFPALRAGSPQEHTRYSQSLRPPSSSRATLHLCWSPTTGQFDGSRLTHLMSWQGALTSKSGSVSQSSSSSAITSTQT
jgi:hypothetical protein